VLVEIKVHLRLDISRSDRWCTDDVLYGTFVTHRHPEVAVDGDLLKSEILSSISATRYLNVIVSLDETLDSTELLAFFAIFPFA